LLLHDHLSEDGKLRKRATQLPAVTTKLLVIGLDAASATLLNRWTDAGHLPNFAKLRAEAAPVRLNADCMETLPGAIWSDIALGEPAQVHGWYFHPSQFFPDEGVSRQLSDAEIDGEHLFWTCASRAGRRCAVVDVPFVPLVHDFNGVQIRELAVHDVAYGMASAPPEVLQELMDRYGTPPLAHETCDWAVLTQGRAALLPPLLKRARTKTAMLLDLMDQGPWDLFFAVYGEPHCGGHQLWPQPRGRAGRSTDDWEPLRRIYEEVDDGIGRLAQKAGPDATIMLFTSHGMGTYFGGPQLIREVLSRLGVSNGREWPGRRLLRSLIFRARLSRPLADATNLRPGNSSLREKLQAFIGASRFPERSGRCRAFAVANNRIGAIRLRIKGRDAKAVMEPDEAQILKARLRDEFLRLNDPASGLQIVKSVCDVSGEFAGDRSPLLPDLLIKFRTDLGPLEHCVSPVVGTVYAPIGRGSVRRYADHVPQSRAWLRGAHVTRSIANTLDLAPTILELLGVLAPAHMRGQSFAARPQEAAE
jgi:predicted AlkP superfamily phosphohydrolase/phosphomutase